MNTDIVIQKQNKATGDDLERFICPPRVRRDYEGVLNKTKLAVRISNDNILALVDLLINVNYVQIMAIKSY